MLPYYDYFITAGKAFFTTILVLVLVSNVIIAHIIAKIGKEKTIGYENSFWISFFFTPLIAILIVIASQRIPESEQIQVGTWTIIGQFIMTGIVLFIGFWLLLLFVGIL